MSLERLIKAFYKTKGKIYTLEEALSCKNRWEAYWMLYSTKESSDFNYPYDNWISYVNYVRSKPE